MADWGATTLVTLMEAPELEALGVGGLGSAAEAAGLEWHHLPITDVQVPDERFERPWTYSGHVLRRKLASGERIVLHCRGGLGRTGTIAARLAIELGAAPGEALDAVRRARSGAVETRAQEAYVRACEANKEDDGYTQRMLGCLLGGAVGDALGYKVEFLTSLAAIHARFGPAGIQEPVLNDAGQTEASDDTQMTLFTAAGLLESIDGEGGLDRDDALAAVREATLDWHALQMGGPLALDKPRGLATYTVLANSQAPGTTCMGACNAGATARRNARLTTPKAAAASCVSLRSA